MYLNQYKSHMSKIICESSVSFDCRPIRARAVTLSNANWPVLDRVDFDANIKFECSLILLTLVKNLSLFLLKH